MSESVADKAEETFGEPVRSKSKGNVKVQYGGRSNSKKNGVDVVKSVSKRLSTAATITKAITTPPATPSRLLKSAVRTKRRRSESQSSVSDQYEGHEHGDDISELSELTPLSSPANLISRVTRASMRTPVRKKADVAATSPATPERPRTTPPLSAHVHKTMLPPPIPRHSINIPSLLTTSKSQLTPKLISMSSISAHGSGEIDGKRSFKRLGMFVWLLVDMKGNVIEEEYEDDDENAPQRMWWPGLNKNENPLQIILYGSVIPETTSVLKDVHNPSERNVRDAASCCFTSSTFLISPPRLPEDYENLTSPQKKQKTDVKSRWRTAVDAMNEDKDENDNANQDVFNSSPMKPEEVTKGKPKSKSAAKAKSKTKATTGRKSKTCSSDEDEGTDLLSSPSVHIKAPFIPPPIDQSINIGEEKIFAKEKKSSSVYWPAYVKYYKDPKKEKEEALYGVKFLDEIEKEIPRSWFFTSDQDEFATCKLGKWQSSIQEVIADTDESDSETDTEESPRILSPEPIWPLPTGTDLEFKFADLSIHQQFSYTKPVLKAILNDTYKPARGRHLDFVKGGTARTRTQESAASRGGMSVVDVVALQKCMTRWILREDRRGRNLYKDLEEGANGMDPATMYGDIKNGTDGATIAINQDTDIELPLFSLPVDPEAIKHNTPSSPAEAPRSFGATSNPVKDKRQARAVSTSTTRPSRQVGCEDYEALATEEKIGYCMNVLLPEAIRQVLLWRDGKRTSLELLSNEAEEELHKVGEEMLQKRDWVYDTMRMRESRFRSLVKGGSLHLPETPLVVRGTKSRPGKRSAHYC